MSENITPASIMGPLVLEILQGTGFEVRMWVSDEESEDPDRRYEFLVTRPGTVGPRVWVELDLSEGTIAMRNGEKLKSTRVVPFGDPDFGQRISRSLFEWLGEPNERIHPS